MTSRKLRFGAGLVLVALIAGILALAAIVLYAVLGMSDRQIAGTSASDEPIPLPGQIESALTSAGNGSTDSEPPLLPLPGTIIPPLVIGEPAPDFVFRREAGAPPTRLSELCTKKPVVLIFSSFTCDLFCEQVDDLQKFYEAYGQRAEFLLVVIREAEHKVTGLEFLLEDENSDPETRRHNLGKAMAIEQVTIPAIMDTTDARIERAYSAFPLRLVVVDRAGRIAFDAPFDYKAGGLRLVPIHRWLKQNLGGNKN